jgi:glutamine synthetase
MTESHDLKAHIAALREAGVKLIRVTYCDMQGTPRGKEIPIEMLADAAGHGLSFCIANLTDGLAGNPTNAPGMAPDRGYPDMKVKPVLTTLTPLPWDERVAWCIGQVTDVAGGSDLAPRSLVERAMRACAARGFTPVAGPELEFFLLREQDGKLTRYVDHLSMVYTTGAWSDPEGVVQAMLLASHKLGLYATAANHEFGRGQYEINLTHSDALDAADRTFRFKALVKEVARRHGLLATFMGKPFNDDVGSGFHLHLSLRDEAGDNAFADKGGAPLSPLARRFLAGVLEHSPALMAFFAPTINSYKRYRPDSLVPTAGNWAVDNRTVFVRVPSEGGQATRLELRAGDGAANPYLLAAAACFAGLDGLERKLEPPDPVSGDVSIGAPVGKPLPMSLGDSLAALQADARLCELLGEPFVNAYVAMKSAEIERFRVQVTEWELNEYAWHL